MKRSLSILMLTVLMGSTVLLGKPKKAVPKPAPGDWPTNLNLASMRVHAVDVIYQLDLTKEQIKALADASEGAADEHSRTTAVGNPKLVTAFEDFYHAQLSQKDDEALAKMRNQLAELVTDDQVVLDDEVRLTTKAWDRVGQFSRQLTAGQIAAYLAFHADEIADPAEKMVGLLTDLHDTTNPTEIENQVDETTRVIGREVAGKDEVKAAQVTQRVADWIKDHKTISADDLVNTHAELEASARKVVGDVPPMELLGHWVDGELAELMSNPQLPEAIEALQANQEKSK